MDQQLPAPRERLDKEKRKKAARLLAEGKTSEEVGEELGVQPKTVDRYLRHSVFRGQIDKARAKLLRAFAAKALHVGHKGLQRLEKIIDEEAPLDQKVQVEAAKVSLGFVSKMAELDRRFVEAPPEPAKKEDKGPKVVDEKTGKTLGVGQAPLSTLKRAWERSGEAAED